MCDGDECRWVHLFIGVNENLKIHLLTLNTSLFLMNNKKHFFKMMYVSLCLKLKKTF